MVPSADADPRNIALGPDGNMWFTEGYGNRVGRVTPGGVVTEFVIPTVDSFPTSIVAGPDGAMWFLETMTVANGRVARISMTGVFRESDLTSGEHTDLHDLAVGPDGNLWITIARSPDAIARLRLP
jgi:virginiamycin B lyase